MAWLGNIFWDNRYQRLRAGWRVSIHLSVSFFLIGILLLVDQLLIPGGGEAGGVLSAAALGIAIVVVTFLAARFMDRRRIADLGLKIDRAWWLDLIAGLLLGVLLMAGIFLAQLSLGWVTVTGTFQAPPGSAFAQAILGPLLLFTAVGFYEELLSRGYQLVNLAEGFSWLGPKAAIWIAWLISSAIFGVLHAGNPNATLISTLNITLAGILLGIGMVLTGRLAMPIGLHITWNFFQGNVFGFPVSGGDLSDATFIAVEQGGPLLWTGGDFGPEAGLIGLIAMTLGVLLSLAWVRWTEGRIGLHIPLAQYGRGLGTGD